MKKEHKIVEADDGIRLDRWFKRHFAGLPHSMLEKQLRKGDIRLDGNKAKSSDRLAVGQVLVVPDIILTPSQKAKAPKRLLSPQEQADVQKWVLYKDASIIVINKPFGLPVQGGTKVTKSVDDLLDALKFDGDRPKLTHRLDRDTSGVLVLARTARMATYLTKGFAEKTIEKTYLALVNGAPLPPEGVIDFKLIKAIAAEASFERVAVDDEDGKYAKTEYRVIESLARRFSLMELKPLTGRTHQLRVHMQAIGCPIVGDHKYGGSTNDAKDIGVENVLHLHAWKIEIPMSGRVIKVSAPLPPHMKNSFKSLGIDVPK
ncbi:MAG: RluA family pseudouridine synthase [Pseudomonadota bacterium]